MAEGWTSTIGGRDLGTEEEQRARLEEFRRLQRRHAAENSKLERLDAADMEARRFGVVEHKPTGALYRVRRGELEDLSFTSATAFYLEGSDVVILEPVR